MKTSGFREVFTAGEPRSALLPELPLVGWVRSHRIRVPGLDAHAHPDALEIFLIERGRVEWWVEDEVYRVPVNHLYLNRPGERHGSLGRGLKPCGYLWFQLRLPPGESLPGLAPAAEARLRAALLGLRHRTFAAALATRDAFRALWEAHRAPDAAHAEVAMRARLHLLLVLILADHRAAEASSAAGAATSQGDADGSPLPSFAIAKALRLLESRPQDVVSVAALAATARLGVTQFSERFYAETGFTPANYLRVQRIELAKRLMKDPRRKRTLTEIAHACGYSSSQHLATVFKRIEGMTPTDYLRG